MYRYRIFLFRRGSIVGREEFRAPDHDAAIRMGQALLGAFADGCDYFDLWQGQRRIPVERYYEATPLHVLPADLQTAVTAMEGRIRRRIFRAA